MGLFDFLKKKNKEEVENLAVENEEQAVETDEVKVEEVDDSVSEFENQTEEVAEAISEENDNSVSEIGSQTEEVTEAISEENDISASEFENQTEEVTEAISEENDNSVSEIGSQTEEVAEAISEENDSSVGDNEGKAEAATEAITEEHDNLKCENEVKTPVEDIVNNNNENDSCEASSKSSEEEIKATSDNENVETEKSESETDVVEDNEGEASEDLDKPEKKGFFKRLKEGLSKTRKSIANSFDSVFGGTNIDDDFYEEIEEILIMSDIGVNTTEKIIDELKDKVKEQHIKEPADCKQLLIDTMKEQMSVDEHAYDYEKNKAVILVIGVNGVGKTTSIGKLASIYKKQGKKVMMAAADTFRAAAVEQLTEWSTRAGVDIIKGVEGQDPASVVYDAVQAAKARNTDLLICDTAGRLHNKKNLMEELKKIHRIIDKEFPDAVRETLVVLDGTTGQNALLQAKEFHEAAEATGIIMTKLDGTAKGGIAVAVQSELNIPVKFIGVGEGIDDLQKFDSDAFVDAMF